MKMNRSTWSALITGFALGGLLATALTTVAQTGASPVPVEELRRLAEVFGAIKSAYIEPVEDRKLVANCVTGMVGGLDDRSAYYDADAFRELQTNSGIGGLGLELGMEDGFPRVVTPIDESPASRAGVRSGDILVRIDGADLKGGTLANAVKALRGRPGSEARITVLRRGESAPLEFSIKREIIRIESVRESLLEGGIVYLRVSSLAENTPGRIAGALTRIYREQPNIKGIVLDLRNNPGGLLRSAVGVSAVFLKDDAPIGTTDGRIADSKARYGARPADYLMSRQPDFRLSLPGQVRAVPLAVLVNRGSASGAEIIAGALQDHKRAVIVGETTFGLGSIQTILPLGDATAVKLTTAFWYKPNGGKLQGAGIKPDVVVEDTELKPRPLVPQPSTDPVLAAAIAKLDAATR